ncbi:lipoyltransferase [Calocera cornea HHB12733]|uniref:lipoyl(octanoyl) transferase n=1 Tax=Calocera cornea HHB12733 TaxID=1353952 RepID=A0A165E0H1_9BASI|nr:lipoyltransferase [Calocera cornea HHB12733]
MALPPVLYHVFPTPLPYLPTLALQNRIHNLQLSLRRAALSSTSTPSSTSPSPAASHPDILLLLQHRPVYTAGRREVEGKEAEAAKLQRMGADWVKSDRGGLTTYHGPGQLVGYPLVDIGRMGLSARCFVDRLESTLRTYLLATHRISTLQPSPSPGLFLSPQQKIASLGISIRHRLTSHGFSLNVTPEPLAWFSEIVACGLPGVSAACITDELAKAGFTGGEFAVPVSGVAQGVAEEFGRRFGREMRRLQGADLAGLDGGGEIWDEVQGLEILAQRLGEWETAPKVGVYLGPA